MDYYKMYLDEHPKTDVVRLTSLAYAFAIDSDQDAVDKFRDWTGYQDTISVPALEDFAKEYGYRVRSEDFVDEGYYNAACRVPSNGYLDWMRFIHRFVVKYGKALADLTHQAGKRAAIFWGDHWAGVEPHQPGFLEMGLDIHVGAAEDGVALRRVSDAPGNLVIPPALLESRVQAILAYAPQVPAMFRSEARLRKQLRRQLRRAGGERLRRRVEAS